MDYLDFVSPHTLIEAALPNIDFGTSTTIDMTFVPANVSEPGLLKPPGAVPAIIALYCAKSKKKGSSLGPANTLMPFEPLPIIGDDAP